MRAITRIVGAAAAAALAVTLTACSSSDEKAADDTKATGQAAESEKPESDDTSDDKGDDKGSKGGLDAGNFHEVLAAALSSGASYRTSITMSGAGAASTMEGEVEITDAGAAMAMTTTEGGVEMSIVVVDGAYYMNMGDLTEGKFVKIDLTDPTNPFSSLGSLADMSDPSKSLDMFKDSVKSVENAGKEDVDGTSATHYVVTVDSSAISKSLSGVDPSAQPSLPAEFVYDFWVDGDDRPVKITSEVMGSTTDTRYYDWNDSSISVEAPSADQISELDFAELLGGGLPQG